MSLSTLVPAARCVLAAVFLVAATAKAFDRGGTRRALLDFGVPARLIRLDPLLPLCEVAVAAGLLVDASARWSALAAVVLLGGFSVAIAWNLARGRRPECRCFGALLRGPVGWRLLARNAGLAALAAWVAAEGGEAGGGLLSAQGGAVLLVATLALAALALVGAATIRRLDPDAPVRRAARGGRDAVAKVVSRTPPRGPTGLAPGSPAPAFELPDLDGDRRLMDPVRMDRPLVIAFVHPGCDTCEEVLPDVAHCQREHADTVDVVVVSSGSLDVNRALAQKHGVERVLIQRDWEIANAYEVAGTPSAVMVEAGMVRDHLSNGTVSIRRLLGSL